VKESSSPSQPEITYIGRSYQGEPVGGPASGWGHINQCSPTVVPARWETASRCRGVVHRGNERGRVTPPPFPLPPHRKIQIEVGSPPLPFRHPSDGTPISLSLCLHFQVRGAFHLPLCGILGQVGILWLDAAAPKTQRKIMSAVKR
jgi:hypothetical protein